MCLVDDPRTEHAKGKKIGIEHLGNVAGGDARPKYLNVPNQFSGLRQAILVEQGIPVWFGADSATFMDRRTALGPPTCSSTARVPPRGTSIWTKKPAYASATPP